MIHYRRAYEFFDDDIDPVFLLAYTGEVVVIVDVWRTTVDFRTAATTIDVRTAATTLDFTAEDG